MYTYKYPHPAVTADCIVFDCRDNQPKVLLIQRKNEPCKGRWAFPGGFMNINETAEDAARRELKEETGLTVSQVHQIGAYTTVDRDPRERVITIAYYAFLDGDATVTGRDDAADAKWFPIDDLPPLAFDHQDILDRAVSLAFDERYRVV